MNIVDNILHCMKQSIPQVICIAASPNKLHKCSIYELSIEMLTADMHLHTIPGSFNGIGVNSGVWVHEVVCMVHRLVLHSKVMKSTIPSPEISAYNGPREN